jgi:signal transduction histidine kinase
MRHGRFAAFVAHELRSPIALQRTLVEVTLADPDADMAALRAMGERVIAGCEHQQRLIGALLDLTRSGQGTLRRQKVDLGATVAEVLGAQDLGNLECTAALEPALTRGDPDLLERLVDNLVANAIRHNAPPGEIHVATGTEARRPYLTVANTGLPIADCDVRRLFVPFQRLGGGDGGVGLGLPIVQAIAGAHRAVLTVQARAGGGLDVHVGFRE